MPRFDGHRIALLERRRSSDAASLVRRLGGTPVCVPSLRPALLQAVVRRTLAARIDAVLFTSPAQFRGLSRAAAAMSLERDLVVALRDRVTVGSVGTVCSRALRASGVIPDVMPHAPDDVSLVLAVAEYMSMFETANTG